MNLNIASQCNDLSEEAAVIADASWIVKARFVEAADTMRHIDVRSLRPAAVRSFWPDLQPEPMDHVDIVVRYRPDAATISRAEEVMYGWLLDHVRGEDKRILLGKWSMCLAAPHIAGSFRDFCRTTGRIRRTAERHLHSEFQHVSSAIIKNAKSLHEPDWTRVSPMMPNSRTDLDKLRRPVERHALHGMTIDAKPLHDPDSPELAALIKRLERGNARRAREAKKREAA